MGITVKKMMNTLRSEKIDTWFDLGLFIDRFKENRKTPSIEFAGSFEDFCKMLVDGGMAFITFDFGVNGVSLEVEKYAGAYRRILDNIPIHYIAGNFHSTSNGFIDYTTVKYDIKEIKGFNHWPLYRDFFHVKLERGNEKYNELIGNFWNEVLVITHKLGQYIEENNIRLLYLINVNSNPGNVSLSLSTVFVSEYLGIPVINNNHDYYWEGGNRKVDIIHNRKKPGPRDHFFTNSDIGEFFSQIEVLFPWESRSWMNVNINHYQSKHLVEVNGINPANVNEIATAIDMEKYSTLSKADKNKTLGQISVLLSRYKEELEVHSPVDVIKNSLVSKKSPEPVIVGTPKISSHDFFDNHIIFLQPTRIITRKRIETSFQLVEKLFNNEIFLKNFDEKSHLNLTILVTGPIATGHYEYFLKLLECFDELRQALAPGFRERVFLGFMFSHFGKEEFKRRFGEYIDMPEIYNVASLVLLPSLTEGRGLPIIEAAANGVPIFCRRYSPENVYAETIGEHLEDKYRLKVLEFQGDDISDQIVEEVAKRIFYPQSYIKDVLHNKKVVQNRYSLEVIDKNLKDILYKLYLQLQPDDSYSGEIKRTFIEYREICGFRNEDVQAIINTKKRHYLPGYGRVEFMLFLKSLIDPSYFRVEEQRTRGMIMRFARELIEANSGNSTVNVETLHRFYNAVDDMFLYREGEIETRHDHSFAYRHRNKIHYPYRDFTHQELTGLVNMLFHRIISPGSPPVIEGEHGFFSDWKSAIADIAGVQELVIDDVELLIHRLTKGCSIAYFPGERCGAAVEVLIVQPIRARLKLESGERIDEERLREHTDSTPPAYIFCPDKPCGKRITYHSLMNYIKSGEDPELSLLFKYGICKIVKTRQWCAGIHFPQLGEEALRVLRSIKQMKGILITDDSDAAVMTDIVDIDRFHIGRVDSELTSRIMGAPLGGGYVQFVPAGIRTTLAYPTPIQTARDFSQTIKSPQYVKLRDKLGEEELLNRLKTDAETRGSPIKAALNNIESEKTIDRGPSEVGHSNLSGIYQDGRPWNGVLANVNIGQSSKKWNFSIYSGEGKIKKVTAFIDNFKQRFGRIPRIAWNGGFILNAELVGKLGLPESYIGSPLGLIISDGKVISPPLFNKPAFLVYPNGSLDIKRVNCGRGIIVSDNHHRFELNPASLNPREPIDDEICFYDLMYDEQKIRGDGRVIVQMAGNTIKGIIHTAENQDVPTKPVGLTLSFPAHRFPNEWDCMGKSLDIEMRGWDRIEHAIEAGPILVDEGKNRLDMEVEGWKTMNSIRTQAARLDYTDMRGPKIAIGLDEYGNLSVLAINGRIRESVGATHIDMAEIMISLGIKKAMGFDPGGSSTLVVDGRALNISPYNSKYERDVYSLPPEPRAVANVVIGWKD